VQITAAMGGAFASICQVWNDQSNPSAWMVPSDFMYDQPTNVSFSPAFFDGEWTPIRSHSMVLFVTEADISQWSDAAGAFELETVSALDEPSFVAGIASFSPVTAVDSGSGTYPTQLTVHCGGDYDVDNVYIDAADMSIWENSN
jgi:hypothetical protein